MTLLFIFIRYSYNDKDHDNKYDDEENDDPLKRTLDTVWGNTIWSQNKTHVNINSGRNVFF